MDEGRSSSVQKGHLIHVDEGGSSSVQNERGLFWDIFFKEKKTVFFPRGFVKKWVLKKNRFKFF